MLEESGKISVELHCNDLSNEEKKLLLGRCPSRASNSSFSLNVVSVEVDGRFVTLKLDGQSVVTSTPLLPTPMVTGSSPEKIYDKEANGQSRQGNNDVTKVTPLSSDNQQHLLSPAKSVYPPASITNNQQYSLSEQTVLSQQQDNGPSNRSASLLSHVTIPGSTGPSTNSTRDRSDPQQKSISDIPERPACEQEESPDERSAMVVHDPFTLRFEMEQEVRKKEHTVHCFLHRSGMQCNLCETPETCQKLYDEDFASQFEKYLNEDVNTSSASANNEDSPRDNFVDHIVTHFLANNCPSFCSKLWTCCLDKKLFWIISKYAPEGLLIHSDFRENAVGTVVKTYLDYRNVNIIGCGGFGNVYKYSDQTAVKEEFKPLIAVAGYRNPELFQRIMELDHPHVIKVLEYIAGPYNKDGIKCFLSVMSYKNQRDIQKQFTKLTCVKDYMKEYQNQEKFIFRNYTVLCRHVFEGLCYLKSEGIIHRDIKSSNILVHQKCKCVSPLQCTCADEGGVIFLLGDMDLLSLEEEDENLIYTFEEWEKMAGHDPAGTIGMKPPESFFRTAKGERMTTHKSDVWSACVALMNVLLGKAVNAEVQEKFKKFIAAATEGTKAATKSVNDSLQLLSSIMIMFESVHDQMKKEPRNSGLVNNEMGELDRNLHALKKLLNSGGDSLQRSQSFHEGCCDIYKEESPLAGILTTVYGARTLHWRCISSLPHIFNTQLWTVMEQTLNTIGDGIKLMPDQRQDATAILSRLKAIPPVNVED